MPRKLPPFAALRAFEAVARRGRLQDAAGELHVSASALSHQLRALETFLGARLFTRDTRGLTLTETGRQYLDGLGGALDRIEAATLAVTRRGEGLHLNVHLSHSLAETWLLPAYGDFLAGNPDIALRLVTAPEHADFAASDLHAAICYAFEPPAGALVEHLIDEVMMPVAAPGWLGEKGPFHEPAALLGAPLIRCESNPEEWAGWFAAEGVEPPPPSPALSVDTRVHALRAAEAGYGLAMYRRPSGDRLLRAGTLAAPFVRPVATGAAYWLVAPPRAAGLRAVKQFAAWAVSACAELRLSR